MKKLFIALWIAGVIILATAPAVSGVKSGDPLPDPKALGQRTVAFNTWNYSNCGGPSKIGGPTVMYADPMSGAHTYTEAYLTCEDGVMSKPFGVGEVSTLLLYLDTNFDGNIDVIKKINPNNNSVCTDSPKCPTRETVSESD